MGSPGVDRPFLRRPLRKRIQVQDHDSWSSALPLRLGIDPRTGRGRRAVGIIAIGNHAYGGLAIGGFAGGLIAIGGSATGLLLAIGGAAIGGIAVGARRRGWWRSAAARPAFTGGGGVWATHGVSGSHADPEAVDFFNRYAPFLMDFWNQARGRVS